MAAIEIEREVGDFAMLIRGISPDTRCRESPKILLLRLDKCTVHRSRCAAPLGVLGDGDSALS